MALTKASLVDLNANELILDLDADTSIRANTDDTVDIKIAGNVEVKMTATALAPGASDGNALGTAALEWSDLFLADGAVINFGDDQDVSLTHVADTGILLSSTDKLMFNDASQFIQGASATVLDIAATDEIELTATLIDVVGNLAVSGTIVGAGALTAATSITVGSAVLTEAELETLDGITVGTAIASKVVTTDANIDTTGQRNLTISGELDAATGDFSGDVDIDGTANLDVVDIDGATQIDAIVTVGVNDTGYDVKFFGATSGSHLLWDESADDLILAGAAGLILPEGKLTLGSTAVTSTATELNLLDGVSGLVQADLTKLAAIDATATELNLIDGGATVGTTAIADGDGLLINDAGTMRVSTVQTLAAYLDDEITAMPNLITTAATTVGALDSGSITSGFTSIDVGAGAITTTGAVSTGTVTATGVVDITGTTDSSDASGDTGILRVEGGASIAKKLYVGTDLDVDGTANLDVVDIDGAVDMASTLQVDGVATFTAVPVFPNNTIETADIQADAITGAKIADDAINSEHYTDGSIDTAHIGDSQVTAAKLAQNSVDSSELIDGSIDTSHLSADCITEAKIADNALQSEHYQDGSIDTAHLADSQITVAKMAANSVDTDQYVDGSIDTVHIADNQVTLAKMAGGTDGNLITYDASGDPAYVATGSDGQVLTSTGAGSAPAFETLAVELTPYFAAHTAGNQVPTSGTTTKMTFAQIQDSDNAYDDDNSKFVVPSGKGGRYFLAAAGAFASNSSNRVTDSNIQIFKNGSAGTAATSPAGSQYASNPGANTVAMSIQTIMTLAANDYIEVYGLVTTNSGAVSFGARTFSGFKIGD